MAAPARGFIGKSKEFMGIAMGCWKAGESLGGFVALTARVPCLR